jgi:hypothetical protein
MDPEKSYRTWQEFEQEERRRVGTFQLSIDDLERDLYYEEVCEDEEPKELDFDL